MRAVAVASAVASAVLAAAGSAAGATQRTELIRPAVGIGKVRLGMSLTQVRRALGNEFAVNRRIGRGFGKTYVELGWDYSWWRVGFLVQRGRYRVVLVATQHRTERTRGGIGVGTSRRTLLRSLPVRCLVTPPPRDTVPPITDANPLAPRGCVLGSTRGRFTVFSVGHVCKNGAPVVPWPSQTGLPCAPAHQRSEVVEVSVREPF